MTRTAAAGPAGAIPALVPRRAGHQFVLYSDSCSGIGGAAHEANLSAVNRVVKRLSPPPEFIVFPGDEVVGLTPVEEDLRGQWRHWLDREMGWLDRTVTPMWHATGNHTAYDRMSEGVFRDVLGLPGNGPADQEGLSYWVRRGGLLLVFVHTLWAGGGGEGHADVGWVGKVLGEHRDAAYKIVVGHHPVFPINGFSGDCQREMEGRCGRDLWALLVEAGVVAYFCSHILAFDVQAHTGVLQICSAGAGTAHRMPEGVEYLHCVQAALDGQGLRLQVLDTDGAVRERLSWPLPPDASVEWRSLPAGESVAPARAPGESGRLHRLRFTFEAAEEAMAGRRRFCAPPRRESCPRYGSASGVPTSGWRLSFLPSHDVARITGSARASGGRDPTSNSPCTREWALAASFSDPRTPVAGPRWPARPRGDLNACRGRAHGRSATARAEWRTGRSAEPCVPPGRPHRTFGTDRANRGPSFPIREPGGARFLPVPGQAGRKWRSGSRTPASRPSSVLDVEAGQGGPSAPPHPASCLPSLPWGPSPAFSPDGRSSTVSGMAFDAGRDPQDRMALPRRTATSGGHTSQEAHRSCLRPGVRGR